MGDSTIGTKRHIQAVIEIGVVLLDKLIIRLHNHDRSKLAEPELSILNENVAPPSGYTTGGLKTPNDKLSEFKAHHYSINRHHPEHHENGIDGMTLIDLLEMFVDWQASVMRSQDGNIYNSIQYNVKRFNISPQLTRILMNTALEFDDLVAHMREEYSEDPAKGSKT